MPHPQPKLADAIANCDFALFDNDGVIYRITQKMMDVCAHASALAGQEFVPGLSYGEAMKLGSESYRECGSSTHVFAARYGVPVEVLHESFHRHAAVGLDVVDESLSVEFGEFRMPRAMLTQAHRVWAYRILDQLNLRRHFPDDRIYALEDVGYRKKLDSAAPFTHVLSREGYPAARSLMIEDSPRNLIHAKSLGMVTVLVTGDKAVSPGQYPHVDFLVRDVREFLAAARGLHPRPRPETGAAGKPVVPSVAAG